MRDPLRDLAAFLTSYVREHPGSSKFELAAATARRFSLKKDRAVYYRPEFAIRFSMASGMQFSNVVLSLSALEKYDRAPFIVCIVRPTGIELLIANSTFLRKISHSSHRLSVDNVRGSFLGHDIERTSSGIANLPDNFNKLFAIHSDGTWEDNLRRLVVATASISPSSIWYQPSPREIALILKAPELAAKMSDHPEYRSLFEELDGVVRALRNRILTLAEIDNVNLRGNAIEQIVTQGGNWHAADDIRRTLTLADVRVDIKTKILTLTSNPKGYNIDKVLRVLATGNTVFAFFMIGVHPGDRKVMTALVSIFDRTILQFTRVQFHWAGRNSRGATQLAGNLSRLFAPEFKEDIDLESARGFLRDMINRPQPKWDT